MPDAHLLRMVQLYRDGIICPGELWNQMAEPLSGRNVACLLNDLPTDLKTVLRAAYWDRFVFSETKDTGNHEYQQFVEWCRTNFPSAY